MLFKQARDRLEKSSSENKALKECVKKMMQDREKWQSLRGAGQVDIEKEATLPAVAVLTPLGSKRTAPQVSPSKRRRVDDQCNVYGMV